MVSSSRTGMLWSQAVCVNQMFESQLLMKRLPLSLRECRVDHTIASTDVITGVPA